MQYLVALSRSNPDKSIAEKRLNSAGCIALRTGQYETDQQVALWYARQVAGIIEGQLTEYEIRHLVGCTYGQYVRATGLKPRIDARAFTDEVRRHLFSRRRPGPA